MTDHDHLGLYPRFIAAVCRLGLRAVARVHVEGLEGLPTSGPLIVAANHMSDARSPFVGGWLAPALQRRPRSWPRRLSSSARWATSSARWAPSR